MAKKKTTSFGNAKLGSGKRFQNCVLKMMSSKKHYSRDVAEKICATIGRKKYGAKKMSQLAAAGRKRKRK